MISSFVSLLSSLLLLIALSSLSLHLVDGLSISYPQYAGLHALYNATNGPNWVYDTDTGYWDFNASDGQANDPCYPVSWQYIYCRCYQQSCNVTSLQISADNVKGTIPSDIGYLMELTAFSIQGSLLLGTVPTEIGLLSNLRTLYLDNNERLQSPVPTELSRLTKLQSLLLYGNMFSELFPEFACTLTSLTSFDISYNNFYGTLPDCIGNLTGLTFLGVGDNRFSGTLPDSLFELQSLTTARFSNCNFQGPITNIVKWSYMAELNFGSNRFSKSIPPGIGSMTRLYSLELANNQLTGTLPDSIGNLVQLYTFGVSSNVGLTGHIPASIGNLTRLQSFYIDECQFSGPIPTVLSAISSIRYISLNNNRFTGHFPSDDFWENFSQLTFFDCYNNFISGSITLGFSKIPSIQEVDFSQNLFSGQIPTEIGLMTQPIGYLSYMLNRITGPIPSEIATCGFQTVQFASNHLSQQLPPELFMMPNINQLSLSGNSLTGYLPVEIGSAMTLAELDLGTNQFKGTIPYELCKLTNLNTLLLYFNQFSKSIPTCFGSMSAMSALVLAANHLTGRIPSELSQLKNLSVLYFLLNSLTGSIPPELTMLSKLALISVENNLMTGQFPTGFSSAMSNLALTHNYFSGSILEIIQHFEYGYQFLLGSNYFTGTIPAGFTNLDLLNIFIISHNLFSGPVDNLFMNPLEFLFSLDLSDNAFTGTLPSAMFRPPKLQSLAIAENCFEGELPASICEAISVFELVLDGLSSSTACQQKIPYPLNKFLAGRFANHLMTGSLPDCVWILGNLTLLHVSGNGLSGSIPNSLSITLENVSVASNFLTGSIPPALFSLAPKMRQLDLSTNKIDGILDAEFTIGNNSYLNLTVNRLSGGIPDRLITADHIAILDGNLFQCTETSKPVNDPQFVGYTCGSSNLNSAMYAWGAWMFGIILCALGLWSYISLSSFSTDSVSGSVRKGVSRVLKSQITIIHNWWSTSSLLIDPDLGCLHLIEFFRFLNSTTWLACKLSVVFVIAFMFVYLGMKISPDGPSKFSTHTEQYGWVTTTAFLHGIAPAVCVMFFATLSLLVIVIYFARDRALVDENIYLVSNQVRNSSEIDRVANKINAEEPISNTGASSTKPVLLSKTYEFIKSSVQQLLFQVINIVIVFVMNGLYVQAVLNQNPSLAYIQVAFSIFKVTWGRLYLTVFRGLISHTRSATYVRNVVFVNIFNMILAPVAVTAITDTTCFSPVVTGMDDVVTSYTESIRILVPESMRSHQSGQQVVEVAVSTTVSPVFIYSFQCGSTIIRNYIPVLMYAYMFSGFIIPLVLFILALIGHHKKYSSNLLVRFMLKYCSILDVDLEPAGSTQLPVLDDAPDKLLKPLVGKSSYAISDDQPISVPVINLVYWQQQTLSNNTVKEKSRSVLSKVGNSSQGFCENALQSTDRVDVDVGDDLTANIIQDRPQPFVQQLISKAPSRVLFRSVQTIATILQHLTVLLTFGIACPLLSIAVAFTMTIEAVMVRLFIGRYVFCKVEDFDRKNQATLSKPSIQESSSPYNDRHDLDSPGSSRSVSDTAIRAHSAIETRIQSPASDAVEYFYLRKINTSSQSICWALMTVERAVWESWTGLLNCCWILIIMVEMFWCMIVFDMVADVWGSYFGLNAVFFSSASGVFVFLLFVFFRALVNNAAGRNWLRGFFTTNCFFRSQLQSVKYDLLSGLPVEPLLNPVAHSDAFNDSNEENKMTMSSL